MITLAESQTGVPGILCILTKDSGSPYVRYYPEPYQQGVGISLIPLPTEPTPENAWVFKNHTALLRFWHEGASWTQEEINRFLAELKPIHLDQPH